MRGFLFLILIVFAFLLSNCKSNKAESDGFINSGVAKDNSQDYYGAMTDYNKAIELNPNSSLAYYDRGTLKLNKLHDYRGAIVDFDKAIEIDPNYAVAYGNRGAAKFNLNDKNSACLDFSKAGELGFMGAYDYIKKYCK